MKSKNSSAYNLEEILALRNDELISNWSKLASLIRAFEGVEWDEAKTKALALMKAGDALEYIEYVRGSKVTTPVSPIEPVPKKGSPEKSEDPRPKQVNKSNYQKLLLIAPGLEEKLETVKELYFYGKSQKTGYKNLYVELLHRDDSGFYLSITQYSRHDGKMVPDPVMEILVTPQKSIVEALRFEDTNRVSEVYDNKYIRELTNKKERKSQNNFLFDWLKELKRQGQKLLWADIGPSSEIIDQYKKAERPEESPLRIVPPTEEPEKIKEVPKEEPDPVKPEPEIKDENKASDQEKDLPKVISLYPGFTEQEQRKIIERFFGVVAQINKTKMKSAAMLKAHNILAEGKAMPFLLDAWDKIKARDYDHLLELNYFRFKVIVPNLLESLTKENDSIRLASGKTKTAFRIELGDNRKEHAIVLGIYQMNNKKPEPTLLIKIDKEKGTVTSDLSLHGFSGLTDFDSDSLTNQFDSKYEAALGFERWLKYLLLQEFKPHGVKMNKVEIDETEQEEIPREKRKYSKNYINAGIPHMEPGKGWLTEQHKKQGITQEMIDWVNKHRTSMVAIPRKKAMVFNTKDKEADLKKQAKGPGLRLSANFLMYPEGRSNRADRTRSGY